MPQVDEAAALGGLAEDHWVRLAVTRAEDDEIIGDVGGAIKAGGGVVDIGYVFRPEFRGRGYASEAVGALVDHLIEQHSIHRIEAVLSPLNPASMRVLESVGMTFESITKLSCCVDGVWEDDLHYAMTADDRRAWLGRNRLTPESVELVEVDSDNADEFARLEDALLAGGVRGADAADVPRRAVPRVRRWCRDRAVDARHRGRR